MLNVTRVVAAAPHCALPPLHLPFRTRLVRYLLSALNIPAVLAPCPAGVREGVCVFPRRGTERMDGWAAPFPFSLDAAPRNL